MNNLACVIFKLLRVLGLFTAVFLASCSKDTVHTMVVSVPDQKMALYRKGKLIKLYDVSTSKFCVSNREGSYGTPLGAAQLNASANAAGSLTYAPPADTVLDVGTGQVLNVVFTPSDLVNFNAATQTVSINVLKGAPLITWPQQPS